MKVDHIFGGHIYVISNFGDARNPIFKDDKDLEFFTSNVQKYLGEICDIYAYGQSINQFHYLIKIRERSELVRFFHKKQSEKYNGEGNDSHDIYNLEEQVPPESYLIFSQEVSNCLNSYAKKFNHRHKRKGGLFGDRYSKFLVESEEEMDEWIEKLNKMEELITFDSQWQVEEEFEFENRKGECSSQVYYENRALDKVCRHFTNFTPWIQGYLRGCFDCLPPRNVKSPDYFMKFRFYHLIKGSPPPW